MDFTLYWFMLPLAILVATTAMLSGIGGTALFMPIFLLMFPLLGIEYQLDDPITAIAAALLTSSFGFISGFIGYYRKGLIDFKQSYLFIWLSIPFALLGVVIAHVVDAQLLRITYGFLLLILAMVMIKGFPFNIVPTRAGKARVRLGYQYQLYHPKKILTAIGGMLTGMLSTGIGEVVMPQLVKDGKLPVPIAAASSVLVVMLTMLVASGAHTITLIKSNGFDAIPWNLVCYTIPGVIIGGQLGPALQGKVSQSTMSTAIAALFVFLGVSMLYTTWF